MYWAKQLFQFLLWHGKMISMVSVLLQLLHHSLCMHMYQGILFLQCALVREVCVNLVLIARTCNMANDIYGFCMFYYNCYTTPKFKSISILQLGSGCKVHVHITCNEEKFITNRYLIVTYLMKSSVNVQWLDLQFHTSVEKVVAKIIRDDQETEKPVG